MTPEQKAARAILKLIEANYKPEHEYIDVEEKDFRHLDLRFYRRTQKNLEEVGFKYIRDIEDKTLKESPNNPLLPVMIRGMVSDDGSIMAGIYHPKPKPWLRIMLFILRKGLGKVIDFETEMSDGSFIVTSNAESASAMKSPPLIICKYFPKNTPLKEVLEYHREAIRNYLKKNPGVSCVPNRTYEEIRASQNRMNGIKAAFRGEIGGIGRDELLALAKGREYLVDNIYREIEKARVEGY